MRVRALARSRNRTILKGCHRARRRLASVLAAASGLALVFPAPAAMATGDDFISLCQDPGVSCQNGVQVSSPTAPDVCGTANDFTQVCVHFDGDIVYVKDGRTDSHSALGEISASSGVPIRICRNPYGNGTWARCNFDWAENANKDVFGGEKITYDNWDLQSYLFSFFSN
jgi:hypothetical protein